MVKSSATPKDFFFQKKGHTTHAYLFSLGPHPTLISKGGGGGCILHMHIHFPMGPRPSLVQNGGGGGGGACA